jgi:hypothetical protein
VRPSDELDIVHACIYIYIYIYIFFFFSFGGAVVGVTMIVYSVLLLNHFEDLEGGFGPGIDIRGAR